MKGNNIVATCRQNRVRRTLLDFLVTVSLSAFMDGQAFAQFSFPSLTNEINNNDPSNSLYSRDNWNNRPH
jgi:hypothetical protein